MMHILSKDKMGMFFSSPAPAPVVPSEERVAASLKAMYDTTPFKVAVAVVSNGRYAILQGFDDGQMRMISSDASGDWSFGPKFNPQTEMDKALSVGKLFQSMMQNESPVSTARFKTAIRAEGIVVSPDSFEQQLISMFTSIKVY